MPEIAFAVPIVPGKEGLDRDVLNELQGSRRDELEVVMRDAGMTRQTVWHQETPDGTVAVVYMQLDDLDSERRFATADAPVIRWFVDKMKEVHGIDISQAAPEITNVFDVRLEPL